MKYLYQQLLAFIGVIALIILIVGTSFTQLTKRTMQANNYDQLSGYAESVIETRGFFTNIAGVSERNAFAYSLQLTEQVLQKQDVQFVFIKKNREVLYPTIDSKKKLDFSLIDKNWDQIMKGNYVYATENIDIYGEKNTSAYVMLPVLDETTKTLFGAMIITQPAKNVDRSVQSVTQNLIKGFIFSGVIALLLSYLFATFQVKRINRMRKATKEITSGNFDIQLPVHDKDEFDDLAEDFNKMAASLKESQEEINRQEERRRQFMADASHEMRTPLTTINGLLEGLQYNAIPENQKENAIKLMQNETARLIRLVNENLDYEKIRTNQIQIVVKKFNGTEALENIVTQLTAKAEAAGNQLYLDTTEPIDVYADYDRFVQVVVNIVQNAIQFTENGEIHIALEKGYLETIVRISDTGIGMTEEQILNIWDRYYKVDPSRKNTKYGESGLGLPIVQQLVRLHKGKINVESELGKGTTFIISFPDVEITEN
ncbi:sensor histidine kinase [Enterococcus faecalis]|uniref:sensor histidine kinase n=1 Tax=Enterococcus TaxID=1350 RepID=UPI0001F0AB2B|nr:HAMP domain-containing sensor histidine kinase [Enterococcus faecalis]EFU13957.1 ATPase/histidine kinase/DNA gyrase B/HSP90 domain protein [Enterococcus faecalis TX1342]EGO2749229.1 HAMP domain-containing histidine kinase [Enterococcus faecalis]EPI40588.1 ATPase/histidine kinase/DNA gyrase B/HSP90 domain protein [Enterococcus faecalis LA3B-2]NAA53441.1 HAMP domain-containing protein [Enterococcus faecalis]PQD04315.1 sensor histidine kinase [Enterococcus faecalis]